MKTEMIKAHMKVAETYAALSKAKRLKVGAIVVKENRVISIGYNGTPSGWDNNCEDMILENTGSVTRYSTKTKPEVIHAEANAIAKLARSSESGLNSDMFITHAPCMECAKLIYGAGISKVYYRNHYRNNDGVEFLRKCNVEVIHEE
jgi:dCMP deaminase